MDACSVILECLCVTYNIAIIGTCVARFQIVLHGDRNSHEYIILLNLNVSSDAKG